MKGSEDSVAPLQLARDRKLVRDVLAGDERALRAFFDTYLPRLYRYALHRLANPSDIDDVVQAVLSQAVRRLETWRGESTLLTWLLTLCRHEISRELSRASRDADMMQPYLNDELLRAMVETQQSEDAFTPERAAQQRELAQLVRCTLDQLPEPQALALELKYIHGASSLEIAAKLAISDTATQSLLARARAAFRELCGEALQIAAQRG